MSAPAIVAKGTVGVLTLPRVPPEEAAPCYKPFFAAFPDGRVGAHLEAQVAELEELLAGLTESGAMFRYAEGKWTIKEVIGHLLDTERIFAYRLLRISRGDLTDLPGFDETTYAPEGQFNLRTVADLVSEFTLQRASTLALVNGIPSAAWPRVGTANGFRTSARAIVYIILGHTAHHFAVLRERYRLVGEDRAAGLPRSRRRCLARWRNAAVMNQYTPIARVAPTWTP